MFKGNSKLENLDEGSKMILEYVFAQAAAETCIKTGAAALQAENYRTVIEETSKGIEVIEKSPEIAEMVAGAMVMLYGMRGPSCHKLGEDRKDASLLQQAIYDYTRLLEYADKANEKQRAMMEQQNMLANARSDRAKVRILLDQIEGQNAASARVKPWWKIW